jgi:hypothetical protein
MQNAIFFTLHQGTPRKKIPHTSSSNTQKTVIFAVDEVVLRREYFSQ